MTSDANAAAYERLVATDPFDRVTSKGQENGLFRSCMKAIRSGHLGSNRLRAVIVVAGLFTDIRIYCDVMALFYVVTKAIEEKLLELKDDVACQKILALGYHFTEAYEQDLEYLYRCIQTKYNISTTTNKNGWKDYVESIVAQSPAAMAYRDCIQSMTTGPQVAGAVFCVWGGLIIGGGAIAMPRVKANYGVDATHVYQSVTGPGREERRQQFIVTWDSLATDSNDSNDVSFDAIVASSRDCMERNTKVLSSVRRNPWWLSPLVVAGAVGVASVVTAVVWSYVKPSRTA